MQQRHWVDLLSRHADQLRVEIDLAPQLAAEALPAERPGLEHLFRLARRLQQTLVPVRPRPDFVKQLKAELLRTPSHWAAPQTGPDSRHAMVWAAAGLGGVLYVAGLGFLTVKAALALATVISGIMAGRVARPALVKAQPAP